MYSDPDSENGELPAHVLLPVANEEDAPATPLDSDRPDRSAIELPGANSDE